MPRGPRIEIAGGMHHVTAKSPSHRKLFLRDNDETAYLQLVARQARERGWSVLTYCLMPNHVHLLIQTPEPDLGPGMKTAHESFGRYVNDTRGEGGHVFGGRFKNRIVRNEAHLVACLRYIARNPVAAHLCAVPDAWPWSAHRALTGMAPVPSFLNAEEALTYAGGRPGYVRLVAQSDIAVMSALARADRTDGWLIDAFEDHCISIDEIARFLNVNRATAYRRLAAARS
jgi:putative transposase